MGRKNLVDMGFKIVAEEPVTVTDEKWKSRLEQITCSNKWFLIATWPSECGASSAKYKLKRLFARFRFASTYDEAEKKSKLFAMKLR